MQRSKKGYTYKRGGGSNNRNYPKEAQKLDSPAKEFKLAILNMFMEIKQSLKY
jgi:hypothetical protein